MLALCLCLFLDNYLWQQGGQPNPALGFGLPQYGPSYALGNQDTSKTAVHQFSVVLQVSIFLYEAAQKT